MPLRINLLVRQLDPCDGYGRWGLHLLRTLTRLGVEVHPLTVEQVKVLPGWAQRMAGIDWNRITVSLIYGDHIRPLPGRQFVYTMWEDTQPPPKWIDAINESAERLIVPCPHNAEAFEAAGVKVQIDQVPGGIDPAEFAPVTLRPERPFTFMCIGDRGVRKSWELVAQAFSVELPESQYPDARLIIKTRETGTGVRFKNERITTWRDDSPDMSDVLAQADCLVFPSKGEGWGMPPREAAAMAIPTIATRSSGMNVGIDNWCTVPLDVRRVESVMGYGGCWDMPDLDEIAAAMRWVYDNQAEARAKALQGSAWLRENQTWEHSARQLMALLERYK